MTKQEAKTSISNYIKCRRRDECPVDECCDCNFFSTYDELNEALDIAIECIEKWYEVCNFIDPYDYGIEYLHKCLTKQIPKKPYKHESDYYVCPMCDIEVIPSKIINTTYCKYCGQALKWEEEND